jgi:hypothetical protein
MTKLWLFCVALAATLGTANVSVAQVVFSDNFNAENGGVGTTNYAGFANWSVGNGTVDLIGNGFFDSYPGNGLYVDLDGSSADAGVLTSTPIALIPTSYLLQFDLGVIGGFGNDAMTVSLGVDYSEFFDATDAGLTPLFNSVSRLIQVNAAANTSLVFDHQGGDNFGLVIDNVRLTLIPEPASIVLCGLVGLVALGRRRASLVAAKS